MAATPNENLPARTNLVNRVLADRYELLETLGEAPLLAAYRARDRSLNRIVTIKTLLPAFIGQPEVVQALKEGLGQTLALTHTAITRTYDVGTDKETGLLYVAEEYVRGIDLKERIRRAAPFQLTAAVDTAIALAEALEVAHARELAHGDVRPQNVLIGPDGQVKLTGWGVAGAQGLAAQSDPALLRRIIGYVAPDPARAEGPTPSGDRYALGCVLFEMLTGETPFVGESATQVSLRHAQDPVPSPRQVNTGVPVALDGVVRKMLGKTEASRYASDAEQLRDLRAVRDALRYGKSLAWSPLDAKEVETTLNAAAPEDTTIIGSPLPGRSGATHIYNNPETETARPRASTDVDATVVMPVVSPASATPRREPIASTMYTGSAVPNGRGVITDEEKEYVPASRSGGARWLLPLNLFLFLVVLASLAGVVYLVSNFLKATEEVIVPQLVGKTLTEAKTLAAQKHFTLSVVDRQFRDNDATDIIYQMGTAPGRHVKEGKAVPIWVSLGPRMVEVPDVRDMAFDKARRVLENKGLRLGEYKSEYDPLAPQGNVISQTPPPGENRPRSTPINLVLSKGAEPAPEPTPDPLDVAPTPGPDTPTPDPLASATPVPAASVGADATQTRYFDIKYPTPSDGSDHRVRIDVLDDAGPHTVFDEVKKSGDKVAYRVEAVGKGVTIKLYDNDELKAELKK